MAANADHGVRPAAEAGRFVPVAKWAPFLLGGLTLLALAAGGMLTVLAHNLRASFDGALLVVVLVVSLVGLVVAHRQPSNVIGWLLLGAAGVFALYAVGVLYTVLDYHRHGGTLPLGRVALALEPSWVLGVMMLGLAVALFPNGQIPSGRWRLVLYVYLAAGVWFSVLWSLSQATLRIGRGFDVDGVGNYVGSQTGFAGTTASVAWSAAPLVLVLLIVFLVRQATVWRGATGERRKQLNWLMSGGAVSIVSIVIVTNTNTSGSERAITDIAALGLTAVPLAIGVGILKYRLYEIDRLISRTISYAILTGLLVGLFVGIIVLATDVLPFSSPVAVAASTLTAAALFNPLRKRVQHLVDRRFNRARYDTEAIVAGFTARLREAVDLETAQSELLHAVDGAVQPVHASLWIKQSLTRPRA
jgi:hypothetical protein